MKRADRGLLAGELSSTRSEETLESSGALAATSTGLRSLDPRTFAVVSGW